MDEKKGLRLSISRQRLLIRGEKRNTSIYARLDYQGWYISFNKEGKNVGLELNCHIKDEKNILNHTISLHN